MLYNTVPETIEKMLTYTGENLHVMALRAEVSYATAHSWKTGKASPNINKFNEFMESNGFALKVVKRA